MMRITMVVGRFTVIEFAHKVNEALSVMVQHVYDHLGDVLKLAVLNETANIE